MTASFNALINTKYIEEIKVLPKIKLRTFILGSIAMLIILWVYSYYSYAKVSITNEFADDFHHELIRVVNQYEEFDMAKITPFDWDMMVVFYPYTSRDEMEKVVGRKWTTHSYLGYHLIQKTLLGKYPLDDDPFNKVVFIKGEKIVLDVTLNRKQVDFTRLKQIIKKEKAQFYVQDQTLQLVPHSHSDH